MEKKVKKKAQTKENTEELGKEADTLLEELKSTLIKYSTTEPKIKYLPTEPKEAV